MFSFVFFFNGEMEENIPELQNIMQVYHKKKKKMSCFDQHRFYPFIEQVYIPKLF